MSSQGPNQNPTAPRGVGVAAVEHPLAGAVPVSPTIPTTVPTAPGPPPPRTPVATRPTATPPNVPNVRITSANTSPTKSLDALADTFLSEESYRTQHRGLAPILRPMPLPPGEGIERLRMLVERRAWGDVLKLSSTILGSEDGPHADVYASLMLLPTNAPKIDVTTIPLEIKNDTVEIMILQCHALLKLRRYGELTSEIDKWNFLKQNEESAVSPEWLSWGIHILAGQAQQYTQQPLKAADILLELRENIPKNEPMWLVSLNTALANVFLRLGEWRLALGSMDEIMELLPAATEDEIRIKYSKSRNKAQLQSLLLNAYKCEILSLQGRTLLQIGALPQVADIFEAAKKSWKRAEVNINPALAKHRAVQIMPCQMVVNEALLTFSSRSMVQALQSFSKALEMLRSHNVLSLKYDKDMWTGPSIINFEASNTVYSECINNMALCSLYTCQMKDAVSLLEGLVREDPTSFLTERVAFNLCTLYELGSDSAVSARRKRVIQVIAKRFFLHDIGPESFRVT